MVHNSLKKTQLQTIFNKLGENEKLVLSFLLKLNESFKSVFPSQSKIADSVGLHRSTISKICFKLEEFGFFKIQHRPGKGHLNSNLYIFSITLNELLQEIKYYLSPIIWYAKKFLNRTSFRSKATIMFKGIINILQEQLQTSSSSQDFFKNPNPNRSQVGSGTVLMFQQPTFMENHIGYWSSMLGYDGKQPGGGGLNTLNREELEEVFGDKNEIARLKLMITIPALKDWLDDI